MRKIGFSVRMPAAVGSYERAVHQFLAVYRFLSVAIGVALMITLRLPDNPSGIAYLTTSLAAAYTVLKILQPHQLYYGALRRPLLAADWAVCVGLVLASGGLDSGLLLYSLAPLLAAALLYQARDALVVAIASPLVLGLGHLVLSRFTDVLPPLLEGNLLSGLAMYTMGSAVMAVLAQLTNINVYRPIESVSARDARKRLARDLHDGLAQSLGYLKWRVKAGQDAALRQDIPGTAGVLQDVKKTVDQLYDEVRASIDWLSDEAWDAVGAAPRIEPLLRDLGQAIGMEVYLEPFRGEVPLSPRAQLELRGILHEALTNAKKHSGVSKAMVSVAVLPDEVEIKVKDEGHGFIPLRSDGDGSYHGLRIMKERAQILGGTVAVTSTPGQGTEVGIRLPLEKKQGVSHASN